MAAGLGFKTFNTGDVLSSGDTNGYLMQGVLVFANAAARTAAIASPQEGQTSYTKDDDLIQVYSGSAWVTKSASAASGSMTLISTTTLSGTTTTISSIPSTYNDLVIYVNDYSNSSAPYNILFRFNADNTASNYQQFVNRGTGSTNGAYVDNATTGIDLTGYTIAAASNGNFTYIYVPKYASTIKKVVNSISGFIQTTAAKAVCNNNTYYFTSSAVSSISFTVSGTAQPFGGGTVEVYGVK
jgi:hypothetical protein